MLGQLAFRMGSIFKLLLKLLWPCMIVENVSEVIVCFKDHMRKRQLEGFPTGQNIFVNLPYVNGFFVTCVLDHVSNICKKVQTKQKGLVNHISSVLYFRWIGMQIYSSISQWQYQYLKFERYHLDHNKKANVKVFAVRKVDHFV